MYKSLLLPLPLAGTWVCAENWAERNFKIERGVLPIRILVYELCAWRVSLTTEYFLDLILC